MSKIKSPLLFCLDCESPALGTSSKKGNALITFFLFLCGIVPGIFYMVYRNHTESQKCEHCGSTKIIPMESFKVKKLLGPKFDTIFEDAQQYAIPITAAKKKKETVFLILSIIIGIYLVGSIYAHGDKTPSNQNNISKPPDIKIIVPKEKVEPAEKEAVLPELIDSSIPYGISHPDFVFKETTIQTDDYTKTTRFDGPTCVMFQGNCVPLDTTIKFGDLPKVLVKVHLVSVGSSHGSGKKLYSLHTEIKYSDKDNPYMGPTAYDKNSDAKFTNDKFNSEVSCEGTCRHKIWVSTEISENFLLKSQQTGIDVKIPGAREDIIIILPKGYVQGFMKKIKVTPLN